MKAAVLSTTFASLAGAGWAAYVQRAETVTITPTVAITATTTASITTVPQVTLTVCAPVTGISTPPIGIPTYDGTDSIVIITETSSCFPQTPQPTTTATAGCECPVSTSTVVFGTTSTSLAGSVNLKLNRRKRIS
jgi:hypothetical protein